jgi:hypothetical protein
MPCSRRSPHSISGRSLARPGGVLPRRSRVGKAEEAVADDERTGEVGPLHSSEEPCEQSRATEGGAGGAKGGGQGERGPDRHVPDAGVSPGLDRVRQAAKAGRKTRFTALLNHLDVALLRWAYSQLKRDAAVGMDDVTWAEYGEGLEARLADLHGHVHHGHIGHNRPGVTTSQNPTAASGHWGLPPWRTKSSNGRWSKFSTRSTRKTSWGSRTVFGWGGGGTTRSTRWSAIMSSVSGAAFFVGAVTKTEPHGTRSIASLSGGCPDRASVIPGPIDALPSLTRGGSRMRESRTYRSVRGARSNARPYRNRPLRLPAITAFVGVISS